MDAIVLNPTLQFEGLGIQKGHVILRRLKKGMEITDEKLDFTSLDPKMTDLLYLGEMLEGNTTVTELCLGRKFHPDHCGGNYGYHQSEYFADVQVDEFYLSSFGEKFYCIGLHRIVRSLNGSTFNEFGHNTTLTFLDLSNNYVNDKIIEELTGWTSNLKTLCLHISSEFHPEYYITNEGAKKLGNWLQSNTTLTKLTIGCSVRIIEGYQTYYTSWADHDKTKEGAEFLKKVEEESTNGLKIQMCRFDE